MNIRFFSGGAGCGKTYKLMASLEETLAVAPLVDGQKVLALTFMHGSRRRLDERLTAIRILTQRYECTVLDSFALRIITRWGTLLATLGVRQPNIKEFDHVCEAAGILLTHDIVAKWVAATYPIIVLDEAQDLNSVRLNIIKGLAPHITLLAAADEFQCLNEHLRPNPAVQWLESISETEKLDIPKRTRVTQLLDAARAVRQEQKPISQTAFKIVATPNAGLAGNYLSNAIGWAKGQRIAVITTSTGQFATDVVDWVGTRTTKKGHGPYHIKWERSEEKAVSAYIASVKFHQEVSASEIEGVVIAAGDARVTKNVLSWLDKQRRTKGRVMFTDAEIIHVIEQSFTSRKHGREIARQGHIAMTVHGAKNREFDKVVVLWPGATVGSADQKRRLLYNAITRAKGSCLVLVQVEAMLAQPPFA